MQNVAQGFLVFNITRSELWLGVVSCAAGLPLVLLSQGPGAAVRVYRAGELEVTSLRTVGADLVADGEDSGDGTRWFVQEEALVSAIDGREYSAVPGVETYWATWSGTHPDTTLWEG